MVIRESPDKLEVAAKIIGDIDKAKPEVVIQVQVVEGRVDKARNLGISPGTTGTVSDVAPGTTSTTTGSSTTNNTTNIVTRKDIGHLTGSDYRVTLPSFTAN